MGVSDSKIGGGVGALIPPVVRASKYLRRIACGEKANARSRLASSIHIACLIIVRPSLCRRLAIHEYRQGPS